MVDPMAASRLANLKVDLEWHDKQNQQIPPPVHPSLLAEPESPPSLNPTLINSGHVGSQHNYVGKNSVHFHRQEPANGNLEFRRSQSDLKVRVEPHQKEEEMEPPRLGDARSNSNRQRPPRRPAKKTLSTKEAERGAEREEEVVDYRHDAQPDKNEDHYREMVG